MLQRCQGSMFKGLLSLICCTSWSDIAVHPSLPVSQTLIYQHLEQKQWGQMLLVGRQSSGSDKNTCQHKWAIMGDGDLQTESSWGMAISNLALFSFCNNVSFLPSITPLMSGESLPNLQGSGRMLPSQEAFPHFLSYDPVIFHASLLALTFSSVNDT